MIVKCRGQELARHWVLVAVAHFEFRRTIRSEPSKRVSLEIAEPFYLTCGTKADAGVL